MERVGLEPTTSGVSHTFSCVQNLALYPLSYLSFKRTEADVHPRRFDLRHRTGMLLQR